MKDLCDICGFALFPSQVHCKYLCLNCGRQLDCSDLVRINDYLTKEQRANMAPPLPPEEED